MIVIRCSLEIPCKNNIFQLFYMRIGQLFIPDFNVYIELNRKKVKKNIRSFFKKSQNHDKMKFLSSPIILLFKILLSGGKLLNSQQ